MSGTSTSCVITQCLMLSFPLISGASNVRVSALYAGTREHRYVVIFIWLVSLIGPIDFIVSSVLKCIAYNGFTKSHLARLTTLLGWCCYPGLEHHRYCWRSRAGRRTCRSRLWRGLIPVIFGVCLSVALILLSSKYIVLIVVVDISGQGASGFSSVQVRMQTDFEHPKAYARYWITVLVYDAVIFLLTVNRSFRLGWSNPRTLWRVLLRDGESKLGILGQ